MKRFFLEKLLRTGSKNIFESNVNSWKLRSQIGAHVILGHDSVA